MAKRQDYQEINLIDYLRTIKRHGGLIAGVTLGAMIVAVLLRLWVVAPVGYYQGEAILSLGTIQEKPIQTPEEIIDIITELNQVNAQKGKSPTDLIISAEGVSTDEVELRLQGAIDMILKNHAQVLKSEIKPIDETIDRLTRKIIENRERLDRFQAIINRLSTVHPAQVIALSGYLTSYNDTLGRIDGLEHDLRELELKKLTYRETRVIKGPAISQSFGGVGRSISFFVSGLIGLFLGLLLGVFWAFAKEWWEVNKSLLK